MDLFRTGRLIIVLCAAVLLLFRGSATALSGVAPGKCGNGEIDKNEQCDFGNLNGATCESLGHDGGTLSCGANCQFDESQCIPAECGNGLQGPSEECELDSPSARCADLEAGFGTASCGEDCTYDTSTCTDDPRYVRECLGTIDCQCDPGDELVTGGAFCGTVNVAEPSECEQAPEDERCRVLKVSIPSLCGDGRTSCGWRAWCGGSGSSSGLFFDPWLIRIDCLRH